MRCVSRAKQEVLRRFVVFEPAFGAEGERVRVDGIILTYLSNSALVKNLLNTSPTSAFGLESLSITAFLRCGGRNSCFRSDAATRRSAHNTTVNLSDGVDLRRDWRTSGQYFNLGSSSKRGFLREAKGEAGYVDGRSA